MSGPWENFKVGNPQGIKPSALAQPVPADQSQAEAGPMPALKPMPQAQASAPQPQSQAPQPSPEQSGPWSQFQAPQASQEQPGMLMQGLDAAGRVLDYPGGFARAGLAEVAGAAMGKPETVTIEDLKKALVGKGPSSAEYMTRLGVPEMGSFDAPLFGKVTGRGVAGFVTDVATDPMVAIAKVAKEVPYISKLINSGGAATEALGERVYKDSLSKIDAKLSAKYGLEEQAPIANSLMNGMEAYPGGPKVGGGMPIGSSKDLADHVDEISNTMGKIRSEIYDKAEQSGIKADLAAAEFPNSSALIQSLGRNNATLPVAEALNDTLDAWKSNGKVDLKDLSSWKSNLYTSIPDQAWTKGAQALKVPAQQFKAALASDIRKIIVESGNVGEKGMGDAIDAINSKWGPLLDAKDPLNKMAQKPGFSMGTGLDSTVLGLGGVKDFAIKKALDLATTTTGRTAIGKAIYKAGSSGLATGVTNRAIVDAGKPDQGQ